MEPVAAPKRAYIQDFWLALERAERNRSLAIWGMTALQRADERDAPIMSEGERIAARERREMVDLEQADEFAYLNAVTLVSMYGALDALVEGLCPEIRERAPEFLASSLLQRVIRENEQLPVLDADRNKALIEMIASVIAQEWPRSGELRNGGTARYESHLKAAGLPTPPGRVPVSLDQAMSELWAIRNAFVHRAGPINEADLKGSPTLRFPLGTEVALTAAEFRKYSAAVRAYGSEIVARVLSIGSVESDIDLQQWSSHYVVGA